jgi:hypothetical protein
MALHLRKLSISLQFNQENAIELKKFVLDGNFFNISAIKSVEGLIEKAKYAK